MRLKNKIGIVTAAASGMGARGERCALPKKALPSAWSTSIGPVSKPS